MACVAKLIAEPQTRLVESTINAIAENIEQGKMPTVGEVRQQFRGLIEP